MTKLKKKKVGKININNPGIDKLSITFGIDRNKDKKDIRDKMNKTLKVKLATNKISKEDKELVEYINKIFNYNDWSIKVFSDKKGQVRERFNNRYELTIYNGTNYFNLKVNFYSTNTKHNFFKVEFNPNKAMKKGLIFIRKFTAYLLSIKKTRCIYFEAPITRIDINIDSSDPNILDYYPHMKGSIISEIKFNKRNEIESFIAGSGGSNIRFTVYDKNAEQNVKSKISHYRLEARIKALRCTMDQLGNNLLPCFDKVRFYHKDFLDDPYFTHKFRNSAKKKGINFALNNLVQNKGSNIGTSKQERNMRKRYLRHMKQYIADPFNLDNLSLSDINRQLKPFKSMNYHKLT